ncbi:MAG: glycosyltransferase family 39 protein [Caldisericia bacterium]|nr:glycosyltransferase family 39 protein [Caldisericia bacterium]
MKLILDKKRVFFLLIVAFLITNFLIFIPKFIYGDEAWSAKVSSLGLISAILNSLNDFHPPLYHILLSLFLYIFPHNEILLRIISLVFGILTIYIILFKLNEFIGEDESKYLGILITVSPFFLYISTLVRMYSLALFLSSLSILFFFNLLKGERVYKIHFVISNILMMLTHHLTIPLFFIESLYFLIKKRWSSFITSIICGIIYLPFSYIFFIQLKRRFELSRGWGNITFESFLSDFFSYLFLNSKEVFIFIIFILVFIIILGLIKFKNEFKIFLIFYFFTYFIMFFSITKIFGSLYFHYISFIIIPSYYLLIEGAFFFKKYKEKVLIFLIILFYIFVPFSLIKGHPEIPQIKNLLDGKKVIFLNKYEMYRYTFNITGEFKYILDLPLNNFMFDTSKKIEFALNFLEKEEKPTIFVYSQVGSDLLSLYDPKGKIKKYLDENSSSKIIFGIYSDLTLFIYFLEPVK